MRSLGIHYVNLQPLTPLPGTGFKVQDDCLVIRRTDYARWDLAHVTLRPQYLTVAQFYRAIMNLYRIILFQPRVLWNDLCRYRVSQIWKMTLGTIRVKQQYLRKIHEAVKTGG
jgi:hypothetical protein